MSSKLRAKITKELMDQEFVPIEKKSSALATAIYNCTKTHPFLGSVLQCINIAFNHTLPTAGIMFNSDVKRWDMYINPKFFCDKLQSDKQRKAVLLHEIAHITHKHPIRVPFLKISARKRMLMNVAADMAINQFIPDIPSGCPQCPPPETYDPCKNELCPGRGIDVKDFHDVDAKGNKVPWQNNKTMEHYYEKLLEKFKDPDKDDNDKEGNAGGGAVSEDLPATLDEHIWDGGADEKDQLEATEELIKRAMIKTRLSYSDLPDSIKDLLEDIKARRAELNYKALINSALKRHASGNNRKHTWTRKSKRFGLQAPGTKNGDLPKLHLYLDSSGSISIEELNQFLEIVDNFLKAGARKCKINLFHTKNYYSAEYKLGDRLDRSIVQTGGTDLTESIEDIAKKRPDLAVFVTDGCYGDVEIEKKMPLGATFPQCLFIISESGEEEHPLKRLGSTIKCPTGTRDAARKG